MNDKDETIGQEFMTPKEQRDYIDGRVAEMMLPVGKAENKMKFGEAPEDKLMDDPKGGFKNMGHFFTDLIGAGLPHGTVSETLRNWSIANKAVMQEGDLPQGGYLVPEQFLATLLQTALETSIVGARATRIPMATNRITIPCLVDDDHSSDYFGGITIYRTEEGGTRVLPNQHFAG